MDKELIEFLNKKFDKIDIRFNTIDAELFGMKEDLKKARGERQNLAIKIGEVYDSVDGFIKVVDRLDQEFTVIKEDINKVKDVIREKLGVDLS